MALIDLTLIPQWTLSLMITSSLGIFVTSSIFLVRRYELLSRFKSRHDDVDSVQREKLSSDELVQMYERYIGFLNESRGHEVIYSRLLEKDNESGFDLLVRTKGEVLVIRAKYSRDNKVIQGDEIFQLQGAMTHYRLTHKSENYVVRPVFYTSAKFSQSAQDIAKKLGVELTNLELNTNYPMVKCCAFQSGQKLYFLPTDSEYDEIAMSLHDESCFVQTVEDAKKKGFNRQNLLDLIA